MNFFGNNKSNKFQIYLGSATIFGGLGFLIYKKYYSDENLMIEIPEEKVIRILRLFKKEFYPIFKKLRNLSLEYQSQYKKKYHNLPESFLKKLEITLTENNPDFKKEVEKIEEKIFRENNIKNQKKFEEYCLKSSIKNFIIKDLLKEIKNTFNKSLRGIKQDLKIKIPKTLSSNIILEIYKNNIIDSLKKLLYLSLKNKRKNGIKKNEEFNKELISITDEKINENIFDKYKIKVNEFIHPELLFNYSLQKFSKENLIFKQDLTTIELLENKIYKKIFKEDPYFGIYEEIDKIKLIGKRKIFSNFGLEKIEEETEN